MATHGEEQLDALICQLPQNYYSFREPVLNGSDPAHRHPDFILVNARLGVIILEIKDWVRILSADTQTIRIRRVDGTEVEEENPIRTARHYAHNLADLCRRQQGLLKNFRGKQQLAFPWCSVVALPNIPQKFIREFEAAGVWQPGEVLGQDHLTPEYFERALKNLPWVWLLDKPLSQETVDLIRSVVNPRLVVADLDTREPAGVLTVDQEREITRPLKMQPTGPAVLLDDLLSQEASDVVEQMSVRLVRGVAGSGKSLVLAKRAEYLAEQYPDRRILILAFNNDLIEDFRRRIPQDTPIEIHHFRKLCTVILGAAWTTPLDTLEWLEDRFGSALAEQGLTAEFVAQEIEWRQETDLYDPDAYLEVVREGRQTRLPRAKRQVINHVFDEYLRYLQKTAQVDWTQIPKRVLQLLQQGHRLRGAYDIILIDEAQDFAPHWIAVIKELLKPDGLLFMCDDPTQSLFRSYSWKCKGVEVVGRTRILRVPFRSTEEITRAAYSLIEANQRLNPAEESIIPDLQSYALPHDDTPLLLSMASLHDEIQQVERMACAAAQDGRVAILCHNKKMIKHWASLRGSHDIYVASFQMMKGLEFNSVFIPCVESLLQNGDLRPDAEAVIEKRRHLYTAMIRARTKLVLSAHGPLPRELEPLLPHVMRQHAAADCALN